MAQSDDDKPKIDEVFSSGMDPEGAIKEVLDGEDATKDDRQKKPDVISDPGVEGGVDEPNESSEEPGTES